MFFKKPQAESSATTETPNSAPNGMAAAAAAAAPPPAAQAAKPEAAAAAPAPAAAAAAAPTVLDAEEAKKRAVISKHMAASFGEIALLMSRSPAEQHYALRDLDWLVAPAVTFGQFALAEAQSKTNGLVVPVGVIIWALVSPEVDQRISSQATGPIRLAANEWRSGDIPWIIHTVGDPKVLGGLMEQLTKTVFKDRAPKMRVRGQDGKAKVGEVHVKQKETAAA